MVEDDEVQGYMFPLGPLMQLFQEVGRGMPGVLSKIGFRGHLWIPVSMEAS